MVKTRVVWVTSGAQVDARSAAETLIDRIEREREPNESVRQIAGLTHEDAPFLQSQDTGVQASTYVIYALD